MHGLEIRRKRALYRAGHRGTKELDLMLGGFAKSRLALMDERELTEFEQFLALPDPDIEALLRRTPAPEGVAGVVFQIRGMLRL